MSPQANNNSQISSVVNTIIPTLILGYIDRIVMYLLADVLRWDRKVLSTALRKCKDASGSDLKDKFVDFLQSTDNEEARAEFFRMCGDFELLRQRTFAVHQLLSDPSKALSRINMHEKMVRWQLHRIYRERNGIVHKGEKSNHIHYLVENAHDYLDQVLRFCLNISSWKPGYSEFISCFAYAATQYNNYMNDVKAGNLKRLVWSLPRFKGRSFIFDDA